MSMPGPVAPLEQALAEALRQRDEALALSRRRSRFLAAACHDLRQPVHALRLFTNVLGHHELPADAGVVLGQMNDALGVLEDLFDDLLDAAQISERGIEPQLAPVALQTLFDRVAVHVRPMAFDKGLDLRFRGGHRVAQVDSLLLERMLRNLVVNALRYTDDGTVLVGCRPRGDGLSLEVWDSGVGLPPQMLSSLFEPVVPDDGPAPRHRALGAQGWGLGLSIVRTLAQAQGLSLAVQSVAGRGSRFAIGLPAAQAAPARGPALPAAPVTLRNRRIAVALAQDGAVTEWLARWQAEVLSGPAQRLAEHPPPDLLLAEDVDTVVALRGAWAHDVPALLLGAAATSASRLHGCRGLAGAPAPNRLRALIAFLLAGGTA